MFKYIVVRIMWIAIILFFIMSLLFIVSDIIMIQHNSFPHPFKDDIKFLSLDYVDFIKRISKWDWGKTPKGFDIWTLVKRRLPISIKINIYAFLFYIPFSLMLGIISAIRKNTKLDSIIGIITLVLSSIPDFIMIFILMMFFGYYLNWFPSIYPPKIATTFVRIKGLLIPIIALSLMPIAQLTRLIRGELTEALEADYLLLVRTKGLTMRQAIFRHALRNSIVPILPVIASTFVTVLAGSFLIEFIYNIPGIASFFLESILQPMLDTKFVSIDKNVIVLICGFYSVLSLTFTCIVDISYRFIDPRMKMGSKK